jgi:hypothetical protein
MGWPKRLLECVSPTAPLQQTRSQFPLALPRGTRYGMMELADGLALQPDYA